MPMTTRDTPRKRNKIMLLNVDSLRLLPDFQIRDKESKNHIKSLKTAYQTGQPIPPIVVAELRGVKYLADGFHRVEALKLLKAHEVEAEIVHVKNEDELRWLAVERNKTHGKPLTNKDKRNAFDIYIKAKKYLDTDGTCKSSRRMAQDFGLWSHVQITKVLKAQYKAVYNRLKKDNRQSDYLRSSMLAYPKGECDISDYNPYGSCVEQHVLKQAKDIYKQIPAMTAKGKRRLLLTCIETIKTLKAEGIEDLTVDKWVAEWLKRDDEEPEF